MLGFGPTVGPKLTHWTMLVQDYGRRVSCWRFYPRAQGVDESLKLGVAALVQRDLVYPSVKPDK